MKKKYLGIFAISTASVLSSAMAFETGDIIHFKAGDGQCILDDRVFPDCYYGVTHFTGSYFGIDTNGDGQFSELERIPLSPGADGGIRVGILQSPSLSHSGCPDGSELSAIDQPWCFFGNTGMHQVVDVPITDNGDGTLDFSGWGVTWNGSSNIPMGITNSVAQLSCSSSPCTITDNYEINFTSSVPVGHPSGFGGVGYQLHLESDIFQIPEAEIAVSVIGGNTQECSSTGGAQIEMISSSILPDDDAVESINWILSGEDIGSGESINAFIPLGTNIVTASLRTVNGLVDIQDVSITVRDTISPVVNAAFIDRKGQKITHTKDKNKVTIIAEAIDVCDPSPTVIASIGAPVNHGQTIKVNKHKGHIRLNVSDLDLIVSAVDASGRGAVDRASLAIIE